jgi:SAM-dependent methyltransferase
MGDAAFVGSIPHDYDTGLGPVIFVDAAAEMARRVAALQPADVLETAAGTGIVTRALRDALPPGVPITATDLNPPMLDVARTKFGAGEAVSFGPADAQALPFPDASFDAVVCQFGVMFYPDKPKSYAEALRVLRPGGHYLLGVWDSHRYNAFGRISHGLVERIFPDDPPQFQRLPFGYTFEEAKEAMIGAGFEDITCAIWRLNKPLPEPERLARGIVYGNPLIEQIRARGTVPPERVFENLVTAYRDAFPNGTMPLQAMFISGRKG